MISATRNWRAHLTDAERRRIEEMDRLRVEARRALARLSAERNRIQNRATQRARLASCTGSVVER